MSHITITGVPGDWTKGVTPPSRLEINTFVKDQKMFSLYVQALQKMSQLSQNEDASHFGVGGIHGLPYKPWQGSGGSDPVDGSDWGGYCTHGSTLFPTWHRPYLALYEQLLQAHAVQIANQYTSSDAAVWKQAAANFRLPYWDWAANAVPPTQVGSDAQVTILAPPNATSTKVNNPLLGYRFNPIDPSFPEPYSNWPTTLRHPTNDSSSARSNPQAMNADLRGDQSDLRTKTYNLLTRVSDWLAFSNHSPGDGGSASNSLEAIHDGIHDDVGANGHMGTPALAALDPIFFIHHCNVDRLLALWQALHPGVNVASGPAGDGTFTTDSSATDGPTSNLTPFWNGSQSYWTSAQTTDFQKGFGYTYPEFAGLNMGDTNAVRSAIAAKVNQLYGGSSRRNFAFAAAAATAAPTPSVAPGKSAAAATPTTPQQVDSTAAHVDAMVQQTHPTQAAPPQAQQIFSAPAAAPQTQRVFSAAVAQIPANMTAKAPDVAAAVSKVAAQADDAVNQVTAAIQNMLGQGHSHDHTPHPQSPGAPPGSNPAQPSPHPQVPAAAGTSSQSGSDQVGFHVAGHGIHRYYDWTARIHSQKNEFKGSYAVLIFIGPVPDDPSQWRSSPSYVGAHHAFANIAIGNCANCQNTPNVISEGFVHLNEAIATRSGLKSFDPAVVEPYLKENLHWRVQKADRTAVATSELTSLEVTVYAAPLAFHLGDLFPQGTGSPIHHHSITLGRPGGHSA